MSKTDDLPDSVEAARTPEAITLILRLGAPGGVHLTREQTEELAALVDQLQAALTTAQRRAERAEKVCETLVADGHFEEFWREGTQVQLYFVRDEYNDSHRPHRLAIHTGVSRHREGGVDELRPHRDQ